MPASSALHQEQIWRIKHFSMRPRNPDYLHFGVAGQIAFGLILQARGPLRAGNH